MLKRAATVGGAATAAWFVNPRPARTSKSALEKLNIAAIGTANRAGANIQGCAGENIVALVDVDADFLAVASKAYPAARTYRDFRIMLEKEAEKIDAVVVGTPDHTHAPAAAMAMRLGKHVYCEKPLAHTVGETRTLAELAKKGRLVTQMGTQIHAEPNYRRVVELIQSQAIGPVREVHVWVDADYSGGKLASASAPANVDWNLWLGPAPQRDYSECVIGGAPRKVHPFHWRWFWDYGTGGLGDFGCHYIDLVHWALRLRHPVRVEATGPQPDSVATSGKIVAKYEYGPRDALPAVSLTWYDGGLKPAVLSELKDGAGAPLDYRSGQLFVGDRGMLISDYARHALLPGEKFADFQPPEPTIPDSIGHHAEWLNAIRTGGPTTCNFDYSGALTEAVLLGVVAYRSGSAFTWDAANLQATGSPQAQALVHKEYRKGWTL